MNRLISFLSSHRLYRTAWILLFFINTAAAQSVTSQFSSLAEDPSSGQAVMLQVANRDVVVLRATVDSATPQQRAHDIQARISRLSDLELVQPPTLQNVIFDKQNGFVISIAGRPLFVLLEGDKDPLSSVTVQHLAENAASNLATATDILREQRRPRTIIYGVLRSLLGTALFATALWGLSLLVKRVNNALDHSIQSRLSWLRVHGLDISAPARQACRYSLTILLWLGFLFASYLWVTFLLRQFPYTRPWGNALADNIVDLLARIGAGIIHALPDIATVVVIFSLAHLVVRALNAFLKSVEEEKVSVPFIYPDTVAATRWLTTVLIWIFALAVAYPHIPGSQSAVFQGISVIAGLMATFGSAGIINQGMSGLMLIYSRALTKGELVQIGDTEGKVKTVNFLSTKLENFRHEEFTIPNAVVVASQIKNFSRQEKSKGGTVSAYVSIGYDTPWRQVVALLLDAANQTNGIRHDQPAQVLKSKLSDFYVEYELVAPIVRPDMRPHVLSELHGRILDIFNEYGVQIMSPNFEMQPEEKVYVAKENWFSPPAIKDAKDEGKSGKQK